MKPFFILLLLHLIGFAAPVTLTNIDGRSITATVTGLKEGQVLITTADGKSHQVPLAKLDAASQAAVTAAAAKLTAQPSATRVSLKAQGNLAGKDTKDFWKTSWGSYDKDVSRTRILNVTISCTQGGGAAEIVVQWIANKAADPNFQGLMKTERLPVTLQNGKNVQEYFAAVFEESDANYEALGERDQEGLKYVGWIVRVVDSNGTVLGMQTSRTTLPDRYPLEPAKPE